MDHDPCCALVLSGSTCFERHSNGMMVLKMVDVSLLHITPGDAELLETQAHKHSVGCPVVYPKDSGYFLLVDDDDVYEEDLRSAGFSDSFMTLFMMARETGAAWIELDADGTDCPSLPKFQHT